MAVVIVCWCAVCAAESGHWLDVPFVSQPAEGCGAASIAMVMQYWEHSQTKEEDVGHIQRALFSADGHGIYASDMQRYFEQNGYRVFAFRGDQALLVHHIESGRPLIVALKPSSGLNLHYVVVAGTDPAQHVFLVNDPAQRKLLKMDSRAFEHEWKSTGNWTLLAVPRSSAP
jgi:ABC-type bacteriocin/lantibiotic exporter with double-glycine peptidase domain